MTQSPFFLQVLEFMDRGSLQSVLKEQAADKRLQLDANVLAAIAYQLLWGLSYLHHERMMHRDVKPGNILLNSHGYVKLSDFGIVASQTSLHTTVVGTIRYMAPERLRARPYRSASDMWSLGLVLLECEIGESPWAHITSMVKSPSSSCQRLRANVSSAHPLCDLFVLD